MASQPSLLPRVVLLVLCLLCGAACAAAAKRRYHSVSMDQLLRSNKAHIDCPPGNKQSVTGSGNKLTIVPAVCGLPPECCGGGGSFARRVLNHDMNRLSTLLKRSSSVSSSAAAAAAPPADPIIPFTPFLGPAPSPAAEAPAVTIRDSTGTSLDTLEFVVTVGFGTPAQNYTLTFDTGSDVSWIQCLPCSSGSGGHCYPQHDPVFDPAKSATYSAVSCGHRQCAAAGGNCSSNGTCLYTVNYADNSFTTGVLSHETLSLTSTRTLPGFAFGCSHAAAGHFGAVDGLIGLGRGDLSLSSQAAATFGAAFSYCLPSYDVTHGYLAIGATTPAPSDEVQYTAMLRKEAHPSLYFVDLVSIDIGGYVVPVPPAVFTKDGTVLDSGVVVTYLPAEAYAPLRDRFKFTMRFWHYKPAPAYDPFDACYDFTGHNLIILPAVSFNFSDGSVFGLTPVAILIYPDEAAPATGCFAFLPRPSTMPFNIIGNTQQRGAEVIYDVAAEKIGFGQGTC